MFTVGGAVILFLYGLYVVANLPVDVFPDLNRPTVTILTEAEGLSPEEVETLVTFPMETVLNGAPGVQRVRSSSGVGLSIIYVEFDWNTDIYVDRQLVAEKLLLARESLPKNVTPVMGPITSIMGEIMLISMSSETMDPLEVRSLADWTVRPRLLTIPGIAQIIAIGGGRKQYQVLVSPEKMKNYNVSLKEVEEAVAKSNENTTGGFIEKQNREFMVRNIGRTSNLDDFANAVVSFRKGVPLLVKDVAEVKYGHQLKRGDAGTNAKPAVILSIKKQPGTDTIELTRKIDAVLDDIQKTLPEGVHINKNLFRQATFIENAINNVVDALRDGALLVIIVLVLFLLNFRTTVITLIAIPLSFLLTGIFLKVSGISINTMTLGGVAVGIGSLVDDGIVVVENIFRRLKINSQSEHPSPAPRVVYEASKEVLRPLIYATILIIIVFLPLFQLSGIEGRIFTPLGLAYIISILSSFLISLTVTPALACFLLPNAKFIGKKGDSPLVRFIKKINMIQLNFSLKHPNVIIVTFLLTACYAAYIVTGFGQEFLPPFNEGTVTVNVLTAPGTSLKESSRIGMIAERQILSVSEVVQTGRRTGRAELDEHAEGVHYSEIDVDLKESDRPREAILEEIRSKLKMIPGIVVNVGQPISHRLDHLISGVNAQIAIKIFGNDLDTLRSKAEKLKSIMSSVKGIVDLAVEKQVLIPQLKIKMNREMAKTYGIQVGDITKTLETAFYGEVVSQVLQEQRTFDVVVRFDDNARKNLESIKNVLIDTTTGVKVPLQQVADIVESEGPNIINRENVQRRIVVQANVSGRDLGSIIKDIKEKVKENLELPQGYFITYGGQFEAQQKASRTIGILGLAALVVMYMILYNMFKIHRIVLAIMSNILQSLIGAVFIVKLTGGVISLASSMGFVTLCGLAMRNGIMMFEHWKHLMKEEGEACTIEMVTRGALERLVPVIMTATTSALGLIPLAISAGEPGKEILQPMAVVMLFGMITSTILDISFTPAFFWRFCRPVADKLKQAGDEEEW